MTDREEFRSLDGRRSASMYRVGPTYYGSGFVHRPDGTTRGTECFKFRRGEAQARAFCTRWVEDAFWADGGSTL